MQLYLLDLFVGLILLPNFPSSSTLLYVEITNNEGQGK